MALWARLLGPRRLARPVVRGSAAARAAPTRWAGRSGARAVYVKELRTWLRDPLRVQGLVMAPVFAILTALLPLLFGSTAFFPFVGAMTALMGAVASANLYGQDGTALWLTLLMPGTGGRRASGTRPRPPRGQELAARPWRCDRPGVRDAVHGRDHDTPCTGRPLAGVLLDQPLLGWAGVVTGLVTGTLCYLMLGKAAAHRLRARGPELLYLMSFGNEHEEQPGEGASVLQAMPKHTRTLLWASLLIGCIALFPQALVPMAMKLSGDVARVWFLALYMPEPLQWPTIAFMIFLAIASFGLAALLYRSELQRLRARLDRRVDESPDRAQVTVST